MAITFTLTIYSLQVVTRPLDQPNTLIFLCFTAIFAFTVSNTMSSFVFPYSISHHNSCAPPLNPAFSSDQHTQFGGGVNQNMMGLPVAGALLLPQVGTLVH
jgi:hypothetical protein